MILLLLFLFSFLTPLPSFAVYSPYTAYCQHLGYQYQLGFCLLPDGQKCPEDQFFSGQCGLGFDYCSKNNLLPQSTSNPADCRHLAPACTLCLDSSSTLIGPAFFLADVKLQDSTCGDDFCSIGENFDNCPRDCPPDKSLCKLCPSGHQMPFGTASYSCRPPASLKDLLLLLKDIIAPPSSSHLYYSDYNCDQKIDTQDIKIWFQNYSQSPPQPSAKLNM